MLDKRVVLHYQKSARQATKAPLMPSDWADAHRILSVSSSSEPGKWNTKRTPYLKEIMDNLHPHSPIKRVVLMKGHQVGYTEGVLMNGLGYIMSENPGPTMLVAPSEKAVKKMLQQKIEPMIYDTPAVRNLMPKTSRATHRSTLIHKDFLGGFLVLCGATVPSDLAGTSVRFLFLDEVDRMGLDVEGEGSPVELAIGRTAAYKRKKIFMGSTPVSEETSVIKRYFDDGDQRYYFVPCPECGHMQTLEIERLDYSDLSDIFYRCEKCDHKISESHKTFMLENGEWRPTSEARPENRSYHLNALYSPVGFLPWVDVAIMARKAEKDDGIAQTFANLYLGIPKSLSDAEVPVPEVLIERDKGYERGHPPFSVETFNTCAVDVQGDRLETLIIRWDKRRAYVDDHIILYGETNSDFSEEPWSQLTGILNNNNIHILGIDSGYIPHRVFSWYKSQPKEDRLKIRVVRGVATLEGLMSPPKLMDVSLYSGKKTKIGNKYYDLNTHILKMEIHKRLLISDESASEYVHFPNGLGDEFYHQLCSERMLINKSDVMDRTGLPRYKWHAIRNRNEAFDLMVYSLGLWYGSGAARWVDRWGEFLSLKSQYL